MAEPTPTRLHAAAVRAWAEASLAALGEERAAIDALNVFPVPDGDTGTNMFLTVESACAAIDEVFDDAEARAARPGTSDVAAAMARGALLGARGNSGVILAQIVRGVSGVLGEVPDRNVLTPGIVARALRAASDEAYAAVSRPVEGTILSVERRRNLPSAPRLPVKGSSPSSRARSPKRTRLSRSPRSNSLRCATPGLWMRAARASWWCTTRCSMWSLASGDAVLVRLRGPNCPLRTWSTAPPSRRPASRPTR